MNFDTGGENGLHNVARTRGPQRNRQDGPTAQKTLRPGEGIGSNYWDLRLSAANGWRRLLLRRAAGLGEPRRTHCAGAAVVRATGPRLHPADLRNHALEVKEYGTKRFWTVAPAASALSTSTTPCMIMIHLP